jgi:hypothetical protein
LLFFSSGAQSQSSFVPQTTGCTNSNEILFQCSYGLFNWNEWGVSDCIFLLQDVFLKESSGYCNCTMELSSIKLNWLSRKFIVFMILTCVFCLFCNKSWIGAFLRLCLKQLEESLWNLSKLKVFDFSLFVTLLQDSITTNPLFERTLTF